MIGIPPTPLRLCLKSPEMGGVFGRTKSFRATVLGVLVVAVGSAHIDWGIGDQCAPVTKPSFALDVGLDDVFVNYSTPENSNVFTIFYKPLRRIHKSLISIKSFLGNGKGILDSQPVRMLPIKFSVLRRERHVLDRFFVGGVKNARNYFGRSTSRVFNSELDE